MFVFDIIPETWRRYCFCSMAAAYDCYPSAGSDSFGPRSRFLFNRSRLFYDDEEVGNAVASFGNITDRTHPWSGASVHPAKKALFAQSPSLFDVKVSDETEPLALLNTLFSDIP